MRKKALYVVSPDADDRTVDDMGIRVFALLKQGYDVTVAFPPEQTVGETVTRVWIDEVGVIGEVDTLITKWSA